MLHYRLQYQLDDKTRRAVKRQIPFLIGGTITGIVMTYYLGFPVTIIVNSIAWYLISLTVYKVVLKKNGLCDQIIIFGYISMKLKLERNIKIHR